MLTLDLNFQGEREVPDKISDFSELMNNDDFSKGFKVVGNNIIPFKQGGEESVVFSKDNSNSVLVARVVQGDLPGLLGHIIDRKNYGENYFIVLRNGYFNFLVAEEIQNDVFVSKIKDTRSAISKFVFSTLLNRENVNDPYIETILLKYLEEKKNYKNRVAEIIYIENKQDEFVVRFDSYLEENGGNIEDYKNYGGFVTKKEIIKKEDL